jgi:post-segregation antitoxin (ccd killing protein)
MTKLTLSVDEKLIEKAKKIARQRGTNVSTLFSQYIETLAQQSQADQKPASLPPVTQSAVGIAELPRGASYREVIGKAIARRYQ